MKLVWCPPGATQLEWTSATCSLHLEGCSFGYGVGPQLTMPQGGMVSMRHGFWMSQFKVSRRQFNLIRPHSKLRKAEEDYPVNVTFTDASQYCDLLTRQEQEAGRLPLGERYRLPTFAEWRYALYAGKTSRYFWGSAIDDRKFYVHPEWGEPRPVGSLRSNDWGLYDMIGNDTGQWCLDYLPNLVFPIGDDPLVSSRDAFHGPVSCDKTSRGKFRVIVGTFLFSEQDRDLNERILTGRSVAGGTEDCPSPTFRVVRVRN
jgi:formylglycine-generating enzyme required for sulfatase activity